MPTLLTVDEVADHLQVSRQTVYKERRAGRLKGVAIAGCWRFDPSDVTDYIERSKA